MTTRNAPTVDNVRVSEPRNRVPTIAVSDDFAFSTARQVELAREGITRIGPVVSISPVAIPIEPSPVVIPVECLCANRTREGRWRPRRAPFEVNR